MNKFIPPNKYIKPIALYKTHENPNCEKLLNLSRYLYSKNIDVRPMSVIEKNFPQFITSLPTIVFFNGYKICGYSLIVEHYEKLLSKKNLSEKAEKFIKLNPNYRITDKSTHKKIKI